MKLACRALALGVFLLTSTFSQQPSHKITLAAKPAPIEFDPQHTALIVVDMQNDFASKNGMFDRAGIDIAAVQKIVPATAEALRIARAGGIKIIYLKMALLPDLSDAGPHDAPTWIRHQRLHAGDANRAPDGRPSRILIRDTWDTDVVDELKPQPQDMVIYKNRFSGFHNTPLDSSLKRLGIRYLLFSGATTSGCVESTLRDATFLDYVPILLTDTTAEPIGSDRPTTNYESTVLIVQRMFGWTTDSKQLAIALKK